MVVVIILIVLTITLKIIAVFIMYNTNNNHSEDIINNVVLVLCLTTPPHPTSPIMPWLYCLCTPPSEHVFYSGGMKFRLQYHRCPHCRQTSLYIAHHPLTIQCHVHSIDVHPHYPHHF